MRQSVTRGCPNADHSLHRSDPSPSFADSSWRSHGLLVPGLWAPVNVIRSLGQDRRICRLIGSLPTHEHPISREPPRLPPTSTSEGPAEHAMTHTWTRTQCNGCRAAGPLGVRGPARASASPACPRGPRRPAGCLSPALPLAERLDGELAMLAVDLDAVMHPPGGADIGAGWGWVSGGRPQCRLHRSPKYGIGSHRNAASPAPYARSNR